MEFENGRSRRQKINYENERTYSSLGRYSLRKQK